MFNSPQCLPVVMGNSCKRNQGYSCPVLLPFRSWCRVPSSGRETTLDAALAAAGLLSRRRLLPLLVWKARVEWWLTLLQIRLSRALTPSFPRDHRGTGRTLLVLHWYAMQYGGFSFQTSCRIQYARWGRNEILKASDVKGVKALHG